MEKVTRKSIQESMNDYVKQAYDEMIEEYTQEYWHDAVRLRSCQACVIETRNYFVLKSYNTIVAFIDKMTSQKFDALRYVYGYTSTSCQHINKFFKDYGDFRVSTYTYREV